jgi:outer membrane lipoprotein-sorting protein
MCDECLISWIPFHISGLTESGKRAIMVSISITAAYLGMMFQPQVEQASDIVRRCNVSLSSAQTAVGSYLISADGDQKYFGRVNFSLKKSNMLSLESSRTIEVFNDEVQYVLDKKSKTYQVRDPKIFGVPYMIGFEAFVKDKDMNSKGSLKAEGATLVTFDGRLAAKVVGTDQTVYVDAERALPLGYEYSVDGSKYLVRYKDVQLNRDLRADAFAFTPSMGMKEVAVDSPSMVKIGDKAAMSSMTSSSTALKTMIANKRYTVLAFVQTGSAASADLLNRMRSLAKDAPKNLGMVVISNNRDVSRMVKGKLGLPLIVENDIRGGSLVAQYGVKNYPTLYVLDSEGVVQHRQIGGSEGLLREALSALEVDLP